MTNHYRISTVGVHYIAAGASDIIYRLDTFLYLFPEILPWIILAYNSFSIYGRFIVNNTP